MDTYKVKWTRLQASIFRLLCIKAGQEFNLREIAKLLSVSPTAISKALPILEKEELIDIKKSKTMNLVLVSFNRGSEKAIGLKRVENLKTIYESGIINFLENEFPGSTIILFGSYSRGDDASPENLEAGKSDIDIAIIGSKDKRIDLEKFEKKLEKEININFYDSFNKIHKHLKDNILNGILLSGGIEL